MHGECGDDQLGRLAEVFATAAPHAPSSLGGVPVWVTPGVITLRVVGARDPGAGGQVHLRDLVAGVTATTEA